MLRDRTIIPKRLQPCVLKTLHSDHQGIYSMMMRAKERIYWVGFTKNITRFLISLFGGGLPIFTFFIILLMQLC